ncbi:GAF and ANTAR domain-containing protein [Streptomyces formicae]
MRAEHPGGDDRGAEPEPESLSDSAEWRRITDVLTAAAVDVDVRQVPAALCRACVELLPISGVSVSITAGSSVRTLWCASDDTAARLAEAQYTLGDGPCQSALELAAPVLAGDLTQGPDARKWPVFAVQAVELGVLATFSLPLGSGALAIGTLDLYRASVGALSQRDLGIAMMIKDAMTFAVLNLGNGSQESTDTDGGGVASWVEAAEADRTEVHQAVGMVMIQLGTGPEQALDYLRAHAFAQGQTVSEAAQSVIDRRFTFQRQASTDDDRPDGRSRGTFEEER